MGLLDLFKKKTVEEAPQTSLPIEPQVANVPAANSTKEIVDQPVETAEVPAESPEKIPYSGDLNKTQKLVELVSVPHEKRDAGWEEQFIENLAGASFKYGDPQVIKGPDGFPYVHLLLPEANEEFQCCVIENMKDDFIMESGLGVVVNPQNGRPDWVLTYGDIVNLHINKQFYSVDDKFSKDRTDETITENEEVMVAQPAEVMLPKLTRAVMRGYFQQNGLVDPKILLLMRKSGEDKQNITMDLTFNATPADFQNEDHNRAAMQSLAWFMPRHYSYVGMNEASFENGFEAL